MNRWQWVMAFACMLGGAAGLAHANEAEIRRGIGAKLRRPLLDEASRGKRG